MVISTTSSQTSRASMKLGGPRCSRRNISPRANTPVFSILFLILLAPAALPACRATFSGMVFLDGGAFNATTCRSGQALGFSGIEIQDTSGRRLRLLLNADGTTDVGLFQPQDAKGELLRQCGTLSIQAQHSRVNSITNVSGTAGLSCTGAGHKVEGNLSFTNCH
jgi:hypothetical protein